MLYNSVIINTVLCPFSVHFLCLSKSVHSTAPLDLSVSLLLVYHFLSTFSLQCPFCLATNIYPFISVHTSVSTLCVQQTRRRISFYSLSSYIYPLICVHYLCPSTHVLHFLHFSTDFFSLPVPLCGQQYFHQSFCSYLYIFCPHFWSTFQSFSLLHKETTF